MPRCSDPLHNRFVEWQLSLGVEDLAAARFAISPLYETVTALGVLRHGDDPGSPLRGWVRWARERMSQHPLSTPLAAALAFSDRPTYPEFITPAPGSLWTTIDDELDTLVRTPREAVRASVDRVWQGVEPSHTVLRLRDHSGEVLPALAAELHGAYLLLIAPHWPRMHALLEADVAFKARRIAQGGFDAVFARLHPEARWDGATLRVGSARARRAELSPGGLVLSPSVFVWPGLTVKFNSSTQTAIRYPARGVGSLFAESAGDQPAGLERLIGAGRARVLRELASPATPTDLAATLAVTPSAVTQHLRVLRDGGLVSASRVGRAVVYALTDAGAAVLGMSARSAQADHAVLELGSAGHPRSGEAGPRHPRPRAPNEDQSAAG